MVNTRRCRRRLVSYATFEDLRRELDAIEAAHAKGALVALGNHTPGAILAHVALGMRSSFEGFPTRAPLWIRVLGPLVKHRVLSRPFVPGFKLSRNVDAKVWDSSVTFEDGMMQLRKQLERVSAPGARPTAPHPFFGPLTPDEWRAYQLRHAELHLSFLQV